MEAREKKNSLISIVDFVFLVPSSKRKPRTKYTHPSTLNYIIY